MICKKQFFGLLKSNVNINFPREKENYFPVFSILKDTIQPSFMYVIQSEIFAFSSRDTDRQKCLEVKTKTLIMAVQRGNVQCVQGAYGESAFEELDEIFYILQPNCIF